MEKPGQAELSNAASHGDKFDHTVLVLQGGDALGAYQAGIYAGLADAGVMRDWIAGVSIGAINAALVAGNPPERRVARLSEFCDRISAHTPFTPPAHMDHLRPILNVFSAASAVTFGVPGFFAPRVPPPFLSPDGSIEALMASGALPPGFPPMVVGGEKRLRAEGQIVRCRFFRRVMTDPAFAWHKNHRRGTVLRQVHGVVEGAGGQVQRPPHG